MANRLVCSAESTEYEQDSAYLPALDEFLVLKASYHFRLPPG